MKILNAILLMSLILFSCEKQEIEPVEPVEQPEKNIGNITYELKSNYSNCKATLLIGTNYETHQMGAFEWKFPFNHGHKGDSVAMIIESFGTGALVIGNIYFQNKIIFTDTAVGDNVILSIKETIPL